MYKAGNESSMNASLLGVLLILDVVAAALWRWGSGRQSSRTQVVAVALALPSAIFLGWILVAISWTVVRSA
jgi:hypothetical protein